MLMRGVGGTYALFGKHFGELADFSAPLSSLAWSVR